MTNCWTNFQCRVFFVKMFELKIVYTCINAHHLKLLSIVKLEWNDLSFQKYKGVNVVLINANANFHYLINDNLKIFINDNLRPNASFKHMCLYRTTGKPPYGNLGRANKVFVKYLKFEMFFLFSHFLELTL
jgi:hypothetical protein